MDTAAAFPIIVMIENEITIFQEPKTYNICRKASIAVLSRLEEKVLDSQGNLYRRTTITPLRKINFFGGFSLKFAGFGVYYVDKQLDKLKCLSIDELKTEGQKIVKKKKAFFEGTTLEVSRWVQEFEQLTEREDILRYLFYFAGTSYYLPPDTRDIRWRERKGFDKRL